MTNRRVYRIIFLNQGEVFEVFAKGVSHGNLFGFVEVEDLLFGERSQVVVDPSEERLKTEFKGVKRVYVPMHAVIRIDEVEKEGIPRVSKQEENPSKVSAFPGPIYAPGPPPGGSGES